MKLSKEIKKETILNAVIVIVYSIITLILALKHEPWRDEAQAWMIAKELPLIDIIKQMKYEGHPCLWHILLMPFAKLNFPVVTLNLISWGLMVLSSIIVIYKSPFSKTGKIAILGSVCFLYYYVAISRVYTLICFLLLVLISLYSKKEKHPYLYGIILALLANTHVICFWTVAALTIEFYFKNILISLKKKEKIDKKNIWGLSIVALGTLFMLLTLFSTLTTNQETNILTIENIVENFCMFWFTLSDPLISHLNYLTVILVTLILLLVPLVIIKRPISFCLYYGNIVYQLFIFIFVYTITPHACSIIYIFLLLICWIEYTQEKQKKITWIIIGITLLSLVNTTTIYMNDVIFNYSSSKQMGKYIVNNLQEEDIILCPVDFTTTPVTLYASNYSFISPQTGKKIYFVTWNEERKKKITAEDIDKFVKDNNTKSIYLLYSPTKEASEIVETLTNDNKLKLLFTTDIALQYVETYQLYKINQTD